MVIRLVNAFYRRIILPYIAKTNVRREQIEEERLVLMNFPKSELSPLSNEEINQVELVYGKKLKSYKELGLFKKHCGFDPRFISHYFYLPELAHKLNDYRYTKLLEHKSLLGHLVSGQISFAKCFVRCVNQEYYDEKMNQLSYDAVVKLCSLKEVLIVKDSVDSAGGKSVEKITFEGKPANQRRDLIMNVLSSRRNDFVIQECIMQHPSMAKFNASSINTFRITTLYLNGKFSVLSIVLRFGKTGSSVDNWGSGGILIGVDDSGKLHNIGYDISLKAYEEYNGVVFKNETVQQLPDILKKIEDAHINQFSLCKFIGWDVCIDENNEPVVIELNSSQPGIIGEQLCTGPIFGERTQEVLDYCRKKKFVYNKSLFNY